jgi:ppGpp synthetase/RelA/SpoT-type nucleotidyltranferase
MISENVADPPESNAESDQVIEDFLENYKQTYYEALAECVSDICKEKLEEAQIQALVTCRQKKEDSLRTKLKSMNDSRREKGDQPFKDGKEIARNIFDLAGVRIALYVPNQKKRVLKELGSWFREVDWKGKRGNAPLRSCIRCRHEEMVDKNDVEMLGAGGIDDSYSPIFAGYVADHARVKLRRNQIRNGDWKEDHVVEVQVVSVLLHAWAEVEHDITYKSIMKKARIEELEILDTLNGMMLSAEVLLNQLHTSYSARVEGVKKPFQDKFALAIFLEPYIGKILDSDEKNNLELKMLFALLRALGIDSPQQLSPLLDALELKNDKTGLEFLQIRYLESRKPFLLARHMHIPFYIIEAIMRTDRLSEERETEAQGKAQAHVQERTDSYRCHVLLSSFLWIGQLSLGGDIATTVESVQPPVNNDAFAWPFSAPSRFNILVDGSTASDRDNSSMDILWKWFESQPTDSYIALAFRVSKLGAFGSFPDDLALLRKGHEARGRRSPSISDASSSSPSSPSHN